MYRGMLKLDWQVSANGGAWQDAGRLSDKVYVTNANPLPFQRGNVVTKTPDDPINFPADSLEVDQTVSIDPILRRR